MKVSSAASIAQVSVISKSIAVFHATRVGKMSTQGIGGIDCSRGARTSDVTRVDDSRVSSVAGLIIIIIGSSVLSRSAIRMYGFAPSFPPIVL